MIRWADGELGLREMCDYGAKKIKDNKHRIKLRLNVFNLAEETYVKEYMAKHHPDIEFFCTRCV